MSETEEGTSDQLSGTGIERQSLVNTAVNFLLNPDIRNRPDSSKVAFLKKKGLTDEEITTAFNKARTDPSFPGIPSDQNAISLPPLSQNEPSFWFQVRKISSSILLLSAALYGLHRFYKVVLEPLLFGKEEDLLLKVEDQLATMNDNLLLLKNSVSNLEETVNAQRDKLSQITERSDYISAPVTLSALRSDVESIKCLLVSKNQFPPMPKVTNSSIPLWQLEDSQNSSKLKDDSQKDSSNQGQLELAEQDQLNPSICTILQDMPENVSESSNHEPTTNGNSIEDVDFSFNNRAAKNTELESSC